MEKKTISIEVPDTGDEIVGVIFKTGNYGRFALSDENRAVRPRKVGRMIASVRERNFLPNYPIVVTSEFGVLDGQHRLKTAEALVTPIYYILDSAGMMMGDVAETTRNTDSWDINDFLEFYITKGRKHYVEAGLFLDDHPGFTLGWLLAALRSKSGKMYVTFRAGGFSVTEEQWAMARSVADLALSLRPFIPAIWHRRGVAGALRDMLLHPAFDPQRLIDQFHNSGKTIYRQAEKGDYLREFAKIYNLGYRVNKISFTR